VSIFFIFYFLKKKELVTRGVGFSDCFEKDEIVARLVEARLQVLSVAVLLQLCCSSVAALLQRKGRDCRSSRRGAPAGVIISVAALLQLCCSSVAALLQLCSFEEVSSRRACR
jgi:hypothetical protein